MLRAEAECNFQGVSTRDAETIFKHLGIENMPPNQVSKAKMKACL